MKKLLALIVVLLLTFALVGCEDDGNYWQSEDYYTQEEVDELIQNAIDELQQQNTDLWRALNDRYVQMEIGDDNLYFHCTVDGMIKECESVNYQDQIDELEHIIDNLEEIIFENQAKIQWEDLTDVQKQLLLQQLYSVLEDEVDDGQIIHIIDEVLNENGFYEEYDTQVETYIRNYFNQMLIDLIEEIEGTHDEN